MAYDDENPIPLPEGYTPALLRAELVRVSQAQKQPARILLQASRPNATVEDRALRGLVVTADGAMRKA